MSTWGGSVVKGRDGLYHAHAAEFRGNCGVAAWTSTSTCRHFTAKAPLGPYTRKDLVQGVFCHNPSATIDKDGSWLLYHLGTGHRRFNQTMAEQTWATIPPSRVWALRSANAHHTCTSSTHQ